MQRLSTLLLCVVVVVVVFFSCSFVSLCRWYKPKNTYVIYGQRTLCYWILSLARSFSFASFPLFLESFKNAYHPEYMLAGWTDFSWKWTHLIFQMKRKQLEVNALCIQITLFTLKSMCLSRCVVFFFFSGSLFHFRLGSSQFRLMLMQEILKRAFKRKHERKRGTPQI